jgi:acetyl esterase/lipase
MKKQRLFFSLLCALGGNLLAEPPPAVIPGKVKEYETAVAARAKWIAMLPAGSVTVLDMPYVEHPFKGSIPASTQMLDLYVPKGDGPFPLIVWIHGGAWKGGCKDGQGAEIAAKWLPEGFAIASLDYRFVWDAPFPGMFQDCIDAVAWLRGHAAAYHLDAARVGVIGHSAGAHIAGVVAMAEGGSGYANTGPPVQATVLWAGYYDLTRETGPWRPGAMIDNPRDDFTNLYPNRAYDPAIAKKMSPVYLIHPAAPPVLLVHGDKDTTAPLIQSQMFADALHKAGMTVTLTNYPDYNHNLWHPDVFAEALTFFKRTLTRR